MTDEQALAAARIIESLFHFSDEERVAIIDKVFDMYCPDFGKIQRENRPCPCQNDE